VDRSFGAGTRSRRGSARLERLSQVPSAFLHDTLPDFPMIISALNPRTTIVSRSPSEDEDELGVYLTTWENHRSYKTKPCEWVQNGNEEEYIWQHQQEIRHEYEGTNEDTTRRSVTCEPSPTTIGRWLLSSYRLYLQHAGCQ
jgi:hypothetical protein